MGWKSSANRTNQTGRAGASKGRIHLISSTALAFALAAPVTHEVFAQSQAAGGRHEIFAGGELETYVRSLQTAGLAEPYPWSLRPLSPVEIDALLSRNLENPWSGRYDLGAAGKKMVEFELIPPSTSLRFNSAFPYGSNDGPIWAGRGLTTSAQAGFFARVGPISLTLAPIAFRAENSAFTLEPTGSVCPPACADGQFPTQVDHPQRFGNTPYQRLDPGQSTLRIDALGASVGITTANEWWGPTQKYPYILSNNAPGFLHFFAGTERPWNVFVGRLHARVIYGRLDQSSYSPVTGSKYFVSDSEPGRIRFASGLLTVFEPRGLTGLELGLGRFFHSPWPASGIPKSYLRSPFGAIFKSGIINQPGESNQLLSLFGRWAFPQSKVELYGEYGRDDHAFDFRDLVQEPDHDRTYSLGLRKAFHVQPAGFEMFHFELMNYQLPPLARTGRGEGNIYNHEVLTQGHTNRGQLLGSALGVGSAAGSSVGWDRYTSHGRVSVAWERTVNQDSGTFFSTGIINPRSTDVSHALTFERVVFLRSMDLTSGLTIVRDFNRNFASDAWNLNALVGARYLVR